MDRARALIAVLAALALAAAGTGATAAQHVQGPQVWFAPLPPLRVTGDRTYVGSPDFMQLFVPNASWKLAARHLAVFKLYGEWVADMSTAAERRQVVADLERRDIAIAVEVGPLMPQKCGEGVEGFAAAEGARTAGILKAAGVSRLYVSFDEPFYFGSIYDGPNACHWSAERIARQVQQYIRSFVDAMPGVRVQFGDTEPVLSPGLVQPYEQWIDTYRRFTGERLSFFHLDFDFRSVQRWESAAQELGRFARSRGVRFGIIYMGDYDDRTGGRWLRHAQQRFELYESQAGRSVDDAVFQSWHDQPDRVLPETRSDAFTNLLLRYSRPRTHLTGTRSGDRLAGRLTDSAQRPIASTRIALSLVAHEQGSSLTSPSRVLGAVSTDRNGRFAFSLAGLPDVGASVIARYAGSDRWWPSTFELPLGPPLENAALGASATASFAWPEAPPSLAVDGDPQTQWNSESAPQWLEIDLGRPRTIVTVRLWVEQTPSGSTVHRLLGSGPATGGEPVLLHEFAGTTHSFDVLRYTPEQPLDGIQVIRVETTSSPSWVGWREIEVLAEA